MSDDQAPVKPRRRNERSRRAILDATRALLLERGFDALTIEGIAATAGVGKQTIYRWWPNRTALVADALADDAGDIVPEIGIDKTLDEDLSEWAGRLAEVLTTERGLATVRTLSAAALEDPKTAARFQAGLNDPMRAMIRSRIVAEDPTLASDAVEAALDTIVGGIVFSILLDGGSYRRERAEMIARIVSTGTMIVLGQARREK